MGMEDGIEDKSNKKVVLRFDDSSLDYVVRSEIGRYVFPAMEEKGFRISSGGK